MKQAEAERKRNQLRMMLNPLINDSGVAVYEADGEHVGHLRKVAGIGGRRVLRHRSSGFGAGYLSDWRFTDEPDA